MTITHFNLGDRVCLYHPDKRRNGVIKGHVVGGGFMATGLFYIIDLDIEFKGYMNMNEPGEQYISRVTVDATNVMGSN